MSFLEAVKLALQQLRVQKLKSFFTLLGVMIGVMFLIAVVTIVEGMSKYMEEDFAGKLLGANTFTLRRIPWFGDGNMTREQWLAMLRRPRFYQADARVLAGILPSGSRYAIESQNNAWARSKYARPREVEAHAVEGDYFGIKNYDLSAGRTFTQQEQMMGTPVVVIGKEVADFFFPNLDPMDRELRVGGIPYRVIGIIEKQGSLFGMSMDKMVIAPFGSPMRRLTNPQGDVDGIMVQAPSQIMLEESMETTRELMRGRRKLRPSEPDNFVMETSQSALREFQEVKKIMTVAGTALPAIGLVIGGMVIMNIMLVAVAERTREVGIRKSIGATRRDILMQFLVEAATLSTVGAVIGITLGIVAAKIVEWQTPLPAAVAPWSLVAATLLGTVVGITAGVYPASRASKLDPIAALRQE
jgi:putative ABC transport system permease protein